METKYKVLVGPAENSSSPTLDSASHMLQGATQARGGQNIQTKYMILFHLQVLGAGRHNNTIILIVIIN